MSWSYSGRPGDSRKDAVRFIVGDTDTSEQLLLDGEIEYLLSEYEDSVIAASIRACEVLAAKFARLMDESVGSVSLTYSQRKKQYIEMRDTLIQRRAMEDATPFAGGISRTDKTARENDDDRVKPSFTRDIMNNRFVAPNSRPFSEPVGDDNE